MARTIFEGLDEKFNRVLQQRLRELVGLDGLLGGLEPANGPELWHEIVPRQQGGSCTACPSPSVRGRVDPSTSCHLLEHALGGRVRSTTACALVYPRVLEDASPGLRPRGGARARRI